MSNTNKGSDTSLYQEYIFIVYAAGFIYEMYRCLSGLMGKNASGCRHIL